MCSYDTNENFSSNCVVLQADAYGNVAENNTLVVDNCSFAHTGSNAANRLVGSVDDRGENNTVTVTNCTFGDNIEVYN